MNNKTLYLYIGGITLVAMPLIATFTSQSEGASTQPIDTEYTLSVQLKEQQEPVHSYQQENGFAVATTEHNQETKKILEPSDYLLKNVMAKNERGCSTDLLGLEEYPAIQNLPVVPTLCITYTTSNSHRNTGGTYNMFNNALHLFTNKFGDDAKRKYGLLHELCHANQDYHNSYVSETKEKKMMIGDWSALQASQEFIEITGYERNSFTEGWMGRWTLPYGSPYNTLYSTHPIELAAEVCGIFLSQEVYLNSGRYTLRQINSVLNNQELREWFNKYVLNIDTTYYSNTQVETITYYRTDGTELIRKYYRENGTLKFVLSYRENGTLEQIDYYRANATLKKEWHYTENETLKWIYHYNEAGTEVIGIERPNN